MKRTNLVLDAQALGEAQRLSGERTYSAVVNRALREMILRFKARRILELAGSGLWDGDLDRLRGAEPAPARPARKGSRGSR